MTKPGGESVPIIDGPTWLHLPSGAYWYEARFHVLKRYGSPATEIRLYRAEDDPGTGGAVLGAPWWIKRPPLPSR